MPLPAYSPEFYNNVAAIAVVFMFTKVVSHGLRKVRGKSTGVFLHAAVIGGSLVAVTASLLATFIGSHGWFFYIFAWVGIAVAAFGLAFDIIVEEREERSERSRRHTRPSHGTSARPISVPDADGSNQAS
jgi:hypothetical protein